MLGAIVGGIIGSVFEANPMFHMKSHQRLTRQEETLDLTHIIGIEILALPERLDTNHIVANHLPTL